MRYVLAFALVPLLALPARDAIAGEPMPGPGAPPASSAAPSATATPGERPKDNVDYVVPMMVTDVAFMGLAAGSWTLGRSGTISPTAGGWGVAGAYAGYVASGALYHGAFDSRKMTGMSLLVRGIAPIFFGALTYFYARNLEVAACAGRGRFNSDCANDDSQTAALVGGLFGMMGATVVEATMLVPDGQKPPKRSASRPAFSITASVSPVARGSGAQAGVVGTF